jgi:hypothetical protein
LNLEEAYDGVLLGSRRRRRLRQRTVKKKASMTTTILTPMAILLVVLRTMVSVDVVVVESGAPASLADVEVEVELGVSETVM